MQILKYFVLRARCISDVCVILFTTNGQVYNDLFSAFLPEKIDATQRSLSSRINDWLQNKPLVVSIAYTLYRRTVKNILNLSVKQS